MKNVRFIYNPNSGETVITRYLDEIISIYQKNGYTIIPYRLGFGPNEKEEMFFGIDPSYHHILVAGGDGTINYVVNAMKHAGIDLPLAMLPAGTANDFARLLGVPSDVPKACRLLLAGSERRIDLGIVNGQYFVNVFSCGLFTEVSQKTPTYLKNNFGKLAYYLSGIGEIPNFRKMSIKIESATQYIECQSIVFFVFNGRTAGQMNLAYLSEIDDGLLDVLVVKGDSPMETIKTVFHFLRRPTGGNYPQGIIHFKSDQLTISSEGNESTDMDGQSGPGFPVNIKCEAGGLRVISPAKKEVKPKKSAK